MKIIFKFSLLFAILLNCYSHNLFAQFAEEKKDLNPTLFQNLYDHEGYVPILKLHTNVKELFKKKSITEEYYIPAKMSISRAGEKLMEYDAQVKIRGNTRKKVCKNAPVKIKLNKGQLTALGLNRKVNKLKLVLQCENNSRNFQQLLKEKLIYDLYEAIDPDNGMRIKLIKLEMYENGELKKDLNAYLVEDEDEYAYRKNAIVIESGKINYDALPREDYFRLCFFQFMIANCDWSIANKHNIELIKLPNVKKLVSIPYDFDYCGLVNNGYAVPPEQFSITSVTQRYFMIRNQMTKEEVDNVVDFYETLKPTFIEIIASQKYMDDKTKKSVSSFIEGFYKYISNRKKVLKAVKPRS